MATYDENKSYASSGVGTAGLTLGVIGTALASGLVNGGVGGILGGNSQKEISEKDAKIARLEAQQYSDANLKEATAHIAALDKRVYGLETAAPLREQIMLGKVQEVATALKGVNDAVQVQISGISQTLAGIVRPFVPNYALAPGYGPAMVAPLPPPIPPSVLPGVNSGTTGGTTDATKTTTGA